MKPLYVYFLAIAVGSISILFLLLGGRYALDLIPEWIGKLTWVTIVINGSAVCSYILPEKPWRWGAIIVVVQPVLAAIILSIVGALENPSSSTGGTVALFVFIIIALMISPLPILASYLGAAIKTKFLPFLFRA